MHNGMRKPHELKVGCYDSCMIDLNEYLAEFHRAKSSDKIVDTKFNEILLNSIPNAWSKQAYMKVFDCENITKIICKYF